jgi:UDP-2,4-diacetamido-2,4,6-trideoxy-beta-L-altropyranose hydrolase
VQLKRVSQEDIELLYKWTNDPNVRSMSVNAEPVLWENHVNWFNKNFVNPNTWMFIFSDKEIPVGVIRFDHNNGTYTLSYSVASEFRNMGYGKRMVGLGIQKIDKGIILAYVKPENISSVKIFLSQGFTQMEDHDEQNNPILKFILIK